MVGHVCLTCDEAGHWLGGLARAEQVGRREEAKVAASENRSLSESVRASGEFWLIYSTRVRGGGSGFAGLKSPVDPCGRLVMPL